MTDVKQNAVNKEAVLEAEKLIKWIEIWVGEFKAREARVWLDKYGTKDNEAHVKLDK